MGDSHEARCITYQVRTICLRVDAGGFCIDGLHRFKPPESERRRTLFSANSDAAGYALPIDELTRFG